MRNICLCLLTAASIGCSQPNSAPSPSATDASAASPAATAAPPATKATPTPKATGPSTPAGHDAEGAGLTTLQDIRLAVPSSWKSETPASSMRLLQFEIPGAGGRGTMSIFRFPGAGGSAEANLARWRGQLQPAEGTRAPLEKKETVNGLTVTSLNALGRFAPGPMPGAPAAAPIEQGQMLAAVVEGAGDPFFFKCTGPAATLTAHEAAWDKMLRSIVPVKPVATP